MAISLLYGKPQRNTDFAAVEYFAAGLFTSIMQVQPPQIRSINTLFVCKGALIYRHVTLCRSDSVALLFYIFLFTGTVSLIDLFYFSSRRCTECRQLRRPDFIEMQRLVQTWRCESSFLFTWRCNKSIVVTKINEKMWQIIVIWSI